MKRLLVLVAVGFVSACGSSSPLAPTPPPPALITSQGNLTVTSCFASTGTLFNCIGYNGLAQNTGTGCAANVRGVTTSFDSATRVQTGSSGWTYSATVRPGEQIAYNGLSLIVAGPLSGGWFYSTSVTWDNVKCP